MLQCLGKRLAASRAASLPVLALLLAAGAGAEGGPPIALDGSVGPAGAALATRPFPGPGGGGTDHVIPSSAGARAGGNLFHSFARFGIPAGDAATFTQNTPGAISHVVARVTGGDPSILAGTLRSEIAGAGLYLINPAGLAITPGAVVDVPAGLHLSTADYVGLSDGSRFSAAPLAGEVLSAAAPAAFGFLGPAAGGIEIDGASLKARAGTLSVVGSGDGASPGIRVSGSLLESSAGDLALVSVGSAGEVALADPAAAAEDFAARAPLRIEGGTQLVAREIVLGPDFVLRGGTRVDLVGSDVTVTGAGTQVLADGGAPEATDGVHVRADDFRLADGARILSQAAVGKAGPVTIRTRDAAITDGAQVRTDARGASEAGDVEIDASNALLVQGRLDGDHAESGVFATAPASTIGDAGRIVLRVPVLLIRGRGTVTTRTQGAGSAGPVVVETGTLVLEAVSRGFETLDGETVERFDVPRIDASARGSSTGAPGSIDVRASERVSLSGWDDWTSDRAGLHVVSRDVGGGVLRVETPLLEVLSRAAVSALSAPGRPGDAGTVELVVGRLEIHQGLVTTSGQGSGKAGTLRVAASESVHLRGGNIESDTFGSGEGGLVAIEAPLVFLEQYGEISSESQQIRHDVPGGGDSGTVLLDVGRLVLQTSSSVITNARGEGAGGLIRIRASESVALDALVDGGNTGEPARIASQADGNGRGGRIEIATPDLRVGRFSRITTSTTGDSGEEDRVLQHGDAGDIEIVADRVVVESQAAIQSESDPATTGNGGTIALHVGSLRLDKSSEISARTESSGRGGTILLVASREISASSDTEGRGMPISSFTRSGKGDGGAIRVVTPLLRLERVAITASSLNESQGMAGSVDVEAGRIELVDGGEISSDSRGRGGAGRVTVKADVIDAVGANPAGPSGIFSRSAGSGAGADVMVTGGQLRLRDGAEVAASATGSGAAGNVTIRLAGDLLAEGGAVSTSAGTGDGGDIALRADGVHLVRSAISADVAGGAGGSVLVAARRLTARDGSSVSARSLGAGDGGDVALDVAEDIEASGSTISASAPEADGGNVTIRAGGRLVMRGSRISADVGDGRGGNVLVAPGTLLLLDGSAITAQAGAGQGGAIRIVADVVVRAQDAVVSASAGAAGIDGTVQIETPGVDFTGGLQPLPAEFPDVVHFLRTSCGARRAGATASFVVTGAEPEPEPGLLPVDQAPPPAVSAAGGEGVLFAGPGNALRPHCGS